MRTFEKKKKKNSRSTFCAKCRRIVQFFVYSYFLLSTKNVYVVTDDAILIEKGIKTLYYVTKTAAKIEIMTI